MLTYVKNEVMGGRSVIDLSKRPLNTIKEKGLFNKKRSSDSSNYTHISFLTLIPRFFNTYFFTFIYYFLTLIL